MKEPRGTGIPYTAINKKNFPFLFQVQLTIPPKQQEYQLLQ